ncbi:hypothetical protein NGRA_3021 [Nosema granulosis]|uniref:Uncharacterized protein n=1 Tax=Nosema granulosis TaxID=83296 RepID=A0A9P6GW21_9MICR|nr:hypothetical protein NGRA_3021 [Nosema granulosis]
MENAKIIMFFILFIIAVSIFPYLIYINSESYKQFNEIFEGKENVLCAFNTKNLKQIKCRFKETEIMKMRDTREILYIPGNITDYEQAYSIFVSGLIFTEGIHNSKFRNAMVDVISSMIDSSDHYLPFAIKYTFLNENYKDKYVIDKYLSSKNKIENEYKNDFNEEDCLYNIVVNYLYKISCDEEYQTIFSKNIRWILIDDITLSKMPSFERNKIYTTFSKTGPFFYSLSLLDKEKRLLKVATDELIKSFKNPERVEFIEGLHSKKSIHKQIMMIQDICEVCVKLIYYVIIPETIL